MSALKRARRLLNQLTERGMLTSHRPTSTYRLQLTEQFGFREVAAVVPYLNSLGAGALYLAPPFSAEPHSQHGYDVTDHNQLRGELGGEQAFIELSRVARAHHLEMVLDFVPNHMGIGPGNQWWLDVLENGPSSVYARYFDIDWTPVKDELENRVLVPVLGAQFGEVLERGELKLHREGGSFALSYYDQKFPIAPRAVPTILTHRIDELTSRLEASDINLQEFLSITTALEKLAPRGEVDSDHVSERAREKEVAKRRLAALFEASPIIREFVDENVRLFNGAPGDPRSFDLLEQLLKLQAYRLAHWRVAGEEINYRRFFDINSLAAIRMEDDRVFDETHRLIMRLVTQGAVTGLRIDHPDGLYSPTAYFRSLQEKVMIESARQLFLEEGGTDEEFAELVPVLKELGPEQPLYVVVEKILEGAERMPTTWQVAGTTGYDFLSDVGQLFVCKRNRQKFDEIYERFIGEKVDFRRLTYEKKWQVMTSSMSSELNVLAHRLNRIGESDRHTRDFTLNDLRRALAEFIACLPIYRTYVEGERPETVDDRDRRYIESTIARAKRKSPAMSASIFDFISDIILLRFPERLAESQRRERIEFGRNVQQVTGPVMAKAIEDTAFYVYNRLISLNDVGCDPTEFGIDIDAFHERNQKRRERWPGSLSATSTHDTKRSEDVRLRISALSEIPEEWAERLARFAQVNRAYLLEVEGTEVPDRNEQLLLYQTLVGTFPDGEISADYVERIVAYMEKALKEAKVHTSWTNVDEEYHAATSTFIRKALASPEFIAELAPLARRIAHAARLSSLCQTALKMMAPGVPDIYQGCEIEDLSLVDPDNRRAVDFDRRRQLLADLAAGTASPRHRVALLREITTAQALHDGRAKMFVTTELLHLRRRAPELFSNGEYLPVTTTDANDRVIAFARQLKKSWAIVLGQRFFLQAGDYATGWKGQVVLPRDLVNNRIDLFSRHHVETPLLAEAFRHFPVAVWVSPDLAI